MKKVSLLALSVFITAFTAYKVFSDLSKSIENWDINWEEDIDE